MQSIALQIPDYGMHNAWSALTVAKRSENWQATAGLSVCYTTVNAWAIVAAGGVGMRGWPDGQSLVPRQ